MPCLLGCRVRSAIDHFGEFHDEVFGERERRSGLRDGGRAGGHPEVLARVELFCAGGGHTDSVDTLGG
jgi:hypothetical protein